MKKYIFILKKVQTASVEFETNPEDTLESITKRIEEMSEEELGFSEPEYHLENIIREDKKISKIVWRYK